ncbi:conserved hypothetical protein [Neospora caninum Liverpool]|uniref:Uncharacterized protein n=1 Tax=Neospora caninum (strain Liverpool) TaxID=572307 RepID=F0VCV2_NEOCL|nr:conserved hypothetical protein [Neospora caninum Liverpool]CBZ51467.1 conserved hypothetical protein [Neospora caninum Liverpool]CEL65417.1 TPA: hypothetical protein BN1204_012650 [Neospora caninum Liverpool]|eukprot:XP_003881500.1 conserved hypothetical protein [Neospora caninum Liverpool]
MPASWVQHGPSSPSGGERSGELNDGVASRASPVLVSKKEGRDGKSLFENRTFPVSPSSHSASISAAGGRRGPSHVSVSGRLRAASSGAPLRATLSGQVEKEGSSAELLCVPRRSLSSARWRSLAVECASFRQSSTVSESSRAGSSPLSCTQKRTPFLRSSCSCPSLSSPSFLSSPHAPPAASHPPPPPRAFGSLPNCGSPTVRVAYQQVIPLSSLAARAPTSSLPQQGVYGPRWGVDVRQQAGVRSPLSRSSLGLERAASAFFTLPDPPRYRRGSSALSADFTWNGFVSRPCYGFPRFQSLPNLLVRDAPPFSLIASDSPDARLHQSSSVSSNHETQRERQTREDKRGLLEATLSSGRRRLRGASGEARETGETGGETGDGKGGDRERTGTAKKGEERRTKQQGGTRDAGTGGERRGEGEKRDRAKNEGKGGGGELIREAKEQTWTHPGRFRDRTCSSKSSQVSVYPRTRYAVSSSWASSCVSPQFSRASSFSATRSTGGDGFHQRAEQNEPEQETQLTKKSDLAVFRRLTCCLSASECPSRSAWSSAREARGRTEGQADGGEGSGREKRERAGAVETRGAGREDGTWRKDEDETQGEREREIQRQTERTREPNEEDEETRKVREDDETTWNSFLLSLQRETTNSGSEARGLTANAFTDEERATTAKARHRQRQQVHSAFKARSTHLDGGAENREKRKEGEKDGKVARLRPHEPRGSSACRRGDEGENRRDGSSPSRSPSSSPSDSPPCPSSSSPSLCPSFCSSLSSFSSPQSPFLSPWKLQNAIVRVPISSAPSHDECLGRSSQSRSLERSGEGEMRDSGSRGAPTVGISPAARGKRGRNSKCFSKAGQSRATRGNISDAASDARHRECRTARSKRDEDELASTQTGRRVYSSYSNAHRVSSPHHRDRGAHSEAIGGDSSLSSPEPERLSAPRDRLGVSDSSRCSRGLRNAETREHDGHYVCAVDYLYSPSGRSSERRQRQRPSAISTRLQRSTCALTGDSGHVETRDARERRMSSFTGRRKAGNAHEEREERVAPSGVTGDRRGDGYAFEGKRWNRSEAKEERSVSEILWDEARKKHRQSLALEREKIAQQRAENARRRKEIAALLDSPNPRDSESTPTVKTPSENGVREAAASKEERKAWGRRREKDGKRHEKDRQLQTTEGHSSLVRIAQRRKRRTREEKEGACENPCSDSDDRASSSSESPERESDERESKTVEGGTRGNRRREERCFSSMREKTNTKSSPSALESSSRSSSARSVESSASSDAKASPREGLKWDTSSSGDDSLGESSSHSEAELEHEGNQKEQDQEFETRSEEQRVPEGESSSSSSEEAASTEEPLPTGLTRIAERRNVVERHSSSTSSDGEEKDEGAGRVLRHIKNGARTTRICISFPDAAPGDLILSLARDDEGRGLWVGDVGGKEHGSEKPRETDSRRISKTVHFAPIFASGKADGQTESKWREGRKERTENAPAQQGPLSPPFHHPGNSKSGMKGETGTWRRDTFSSSPSSPSSDASSQESSLAKEAAAHSGPYAMGGARDGSPVGSSSSEEGEAQEPPSAERKPIKRHTASLSSHSRPFSPPKAPSFSDVCLPGQETKKRGERRPFSSTSSSSVCAFPALSASPRSSGSRTRSTPLGPPYVGRLSTSLFPSSSAGESAISSSQTQDQHLFLSPFAPKRTVTSPKPTKPRKTQTLQIRGNASPGTDTALRKKREDTRMELAASEEPEKKSCSH